MAQGYVNLVEAGSEKALANIAEAKRREIQQYEKIVRFQQSILSGSHPSIRPSGDALASAKSSLVRSSIPQPLTGNGQRHAAHAQRPVGPESSLRPAASPTSPSATKAYGPGTTEINPVLLEKSDDLIKAEIQLQRQRIERSLKEDVRQRSSAKNGGQAETSADFDLSEILAKALKVVQASAAPLPSDEKASATNHDLSSDSFDENTFYSSHHNTPDSVLMSRVHNRSEENDALDQTSIPTSHNQPPRNNGHMAAKPPAVESDAHQNSQARPNYNTYGSYASTEYSHVPGLGNPSNQAAAPVATVQQANDEQTLSDDSGNPEVTSQQGPQVGKPNSAMHTPSLLTRVNERLIPSNPSANASPLTATRRPAPAAEVVSNSSTGTPAQVTALRGEASNATSPEGSQQGGRASEKKKGKKKKRKADKQVEAAEPTPYIKPEPRSPSPLAGASYIRPNKRQRHSQHQQPVPDYEPARYEAQTGIVPRDPYPGQRTSDGRIYVGYEGADPYMSAPAPLPANSRYGRDYRDERYVSGSPHIVGQTPYVSVPGSHPEEMHPPRSSSQLRSHEGYSRASWSYQGYPAPPATVVHEGSGYAPPRPPPTRIIVDDFGREYIEPPRPRVVRHSVAPPMRPGEPEVIYEGPVAVAAAPPMYSRRRLSPQYVPRRVVTQPGQDYRDNRHRGYSTRPMATSGEFVEVMGPPDRRHMEEGQYISRSASVRPPEPLRYEVPGDYGRVQSVRPESVVRHYAASAHPESRREPGQPYMREYTGAMEPGTARREYSRPVERFYEPEARAGEEIAFIERPRGATQEIVYADDARREVYR